MSTNDLKRFVFGVPDKSVDNFNPKISGVPALDPSTVNVSSGIKRGTGVRYATAPLGGHNNTETPAANQTNGLQYSESVSVGSTGLRNRGYIFGIVPVTMSPYDGNYPKTSKQYYAYLVGLKSNTVFVPDSLDVVLGATLESSVNKQAADLTKGLAQSSYFADSPFIRLHKTELMNLPLNSAVVSSSAQAVLSMIPDKWFVPYAHISVSGKRIPYFWMFAKATSTPATTTAPNLNLWSKQVSVGNNADVLGGSPSEIITREFTDNNQRLISIYCLDDDGFPIDMKYTKQITASNTASVPAYGSGDNYTGLTGATRTGASTSYASVACAVVNDPGSYTNSRHEAILVAGETPFAVVYQDWLQAPNGMMPRWIDLTNPGCIPRVGVSTNVISFGSGLFPAEKNDAASSYVSGGTYVSPGDTGTGFLKKDTAYDVGFSYYNKLLDYETNVVFGNTVYVPDSLTTDNFCLFAEPNNQVTDNVFERVITNIANMPWEYSNNAASVSAGSVSGRGMHINDYEIRFYYREAGIGEWLPAGAYDAARYFFGVWSGTTSIFGAPRALFYGPTICAGPQGATVGGQPNGFNDYSPLPKQRYICSLVFQQRAFWFSEKDFRFSLQNNIYAYPLRNVVSSQTGKWRGAIQFSRLDQSTLQGSMIVFGEGEVYSAWFNGNRRTTPVRVSFQEVRDQPIDGSDFTLDYLSDSTSFSYRSAVVAEGVAYWWGPQGVYKYEGMGKPKKISGSLEPDINDYVDMGRDEEVHCVYIKRCNEIVWFYPPKVTDATYPTYGLAYNVETGNFYPYKFKFQVDSAQNLKIENDETPDYVDGDRVMLHCRETSASTVQRTYFFDDIAIAGDQGPAQQLSVISFSTPVAGQRRLVLAAGSAGITASGIVANDYISFQNVKGYAPGLTLAPDMIAKITAVNNASNYIDILLPDGGAFDASATLTGQTAFPVYHRGFDSAGLNGIPYLYQTNYWLADGLYQAWVWQYLYFLFKYPGIPQPMDPFHPTEGLLSRINLTFESTSGDAQTDILSLINNTKDHCQIHHPLYNQERSANGQALRFALSGIYIGDHWTFEYMEAHCLEEFGFTLKEFEG